MSFIVFVLFSSDSVDHLLDFHKRIADGPGGHPVEWSWRPLRPYCEGSSSTGLEGPAAGQRHSVLKCRPCYSERFLCSPAAVSKLYDYGGPQWVVKSDRGAGAAADG